MAQYSDRASDNPPGAPGSGIPAKVPTVSSAQNAGGARLRMAFTRPGQRRRWCLTALVLLIDAVVVAPLIGHGSLHLLDFGDYPDSPHPPFAPSAFGFPPGITNRAPVEAMLYWIYHGTHWAPVGLLPFAAVAPLACAGFSRIFPGRGLAIGAATLLFTVNPFVFERMANGQVYVVMGYSLLPLLLALAIKPLGSLVATATLGGLVFTLAVALSVHYLFIAGLLLGIVVVAHTALRRAREARAGIAIALCSAVLNLYWLVPAARDRHTMQSHVTSLDLSVFQTLGDRMWGLGINVAGLYGFWRPGPPLVKNHISGWPFLLLAMLVVAAFGFREMLTRGGPAGRALALSCALFAIVGGLLALGTQGPAGGMYGWLFAHLPGFNVMREAEKFSALLALGYAACFGAGTEAVALSLTRNWSRALCACCVVAIPLLYGYTELWGFDGYSRPAPYPASWAAADRAMSPGATALALPWRAYLPVPWIKNQVVANPVQGYFARPVISGDDLEAGPISTETSNPRSLFLQFCLSEGHRLTEFGRLLAPLGIRYVILAKVPGEQSYAWLNKQQDMRRVFAADSIAVYENEETVPTAYSPSRRLVLQNWGQVVALSQRTPLTGYLIQVRHARPGPVNMSVAAAIRTAASPALIETSGSTSVSETVDLPRGTRSVALTNPSYDGWQLPGFRTTSQFGVTVAFTRPGSPDLPASLVATYRPWRLVEASDLAGGCLLAGDITLLTVALTRRRHWARIGSQVRAWRLAWRRG